MPNLSPKRFFSPFFLLLVLATLIAVAIQTYAFLLNLKRISPNDPITVDEFFRSLSIGFSNVHFLYVFIAFFLVLFIVRLAEKHSMLAKVFVILGIVWILIHIFFPSFPFVILLSLYPLISFADSGLLVLSALFADSGLLVLSTLTAWEKSNFSFLIWLLVVATLPILITKTFRFDKLRGTPRSIFMLLFGFIALLSFTFWYCDSLVPSIDSLWKEKTARIQEYYADPEFTIFTPTYLPEWADTITEEEAKDVSLFYSITPEINGRMYFREYSRGLKITQYKPKEVLAEEELYQKSLEHLQNRAEFARFAPKNVEELTIGQYRALYYHVGSIEEYLNLYRDGQLIEISLNPNELSYHFRHNLRYLENKEMLISTRDRYNLSMRFSDGSVMLG